MATASSAAARRDLTPRDPSSRLGNFLQQQQADLASQARLRQASSQPANEIARPQLVPSPPAQSPTGSFQPSPAQEAARIARFKKSPLQLTEAGPANDNNFYDGLASSGEGLSDSSVPSEDQDSGVLNAQGGDPYAEDRSMADKTKDANARTQLLTGRPQENAIANANSSSENAQVIGSGPSSAASGLSPTDQARESTGKDLAKFQRGIQETKRADDAKKKTSLAQKQQQMVQNVNLIKERIKKIRDLASIGTGVGIVYYVAKLDITIANRYFLKRKYLWGYRDEADYEGNQVLKLNDTLDGIEWFAFLSIRVLAVSVPILILFVYFILPIVISQHAGQILGEALAGQLRRMLPGSH